MDERGFVKQTPLVSILMNCYNGEKYLREAIESVLAQTYQNWEVIFWDNQSTDRSAAIFKSYSDPRLKYFYAPTHTNLGGGRAAAWPHLTGEFIAILDADDVWLPQKLEKQLPLFADPEVGIVCSNALFFNEKTEKVRYVRKYPPTGWVFEKLLLDYYIVLVTLVFRKSSAEKLSRTFDPDFSSITDFDLVLRLSLISKLALCPEILAKWRVHENSETWRCFESFFEEKERWIQKQLAEKSFPAQKFSASIQKFQDKNTHTKSFVALLHGGRNLAFKTLLQARLHHWKTWALLVFCCLPFSNVLAHYLYKRKMELA